MSRFRSKSKFIGPLSGKNARDENELHASEVGEMVGELILSQDGTPRDGESSAPLRRCSKPWLYKRNPHTVLGYVLLRITRREVPTRDSLLAGNASIRGAASVHTWSSHNGLYRSYSVARHQEEAGVIQASDLKRKIS